MIIKQMMLVLFIWLFTLSNAISTIITMNNANDERLFETITMNNANDERIFVTHNAYEFISVIYPTLDNFIFTIPVGNRLSGIESSFDNKCVYVVSFQDNVLSIIDTATNEVSYTIKTGNGPDLIAVNPDGNYVYVTNVFDNTVSIIEINKKQVLATINVGMNPQGITLHPDGSKIYVANYDEDTITIFNSNPDTAKSSIKTFQIPNEAEDAHSSLGLTGITINPEGTHIFTVSKLSNQLIILSSDNGEIIDTIDVGNAPQHLIIPNLQSVNKILVSNSWGASISIFNFDMVWSQYNKVDLHFSGFPQRMAHSKSNLSLIYVTDYLFDSIVAIKTDKNDSVQTIACHAKPLDIAPIGKGLLVQSFLGKVVTKNFAGFEQIGVKDATIVLTNTANILLKTKTDSFGHFIMNNVAVGDYTIEVKAKGFLPVKDEILIERANSYKIEFTLEANTSDVSGNEKVGVEDAVYILKQITNTDN